MSSLVHRLRHPRRCYAICAVARSGSHLLCDGLRATRKAGRPQRFFYEPVEERYGLKYRLDPVRDYAGFVRGIVSGTPTSNALFGFKLMGWDLARLVSKLRASGEFGASDAPEMELLLAAFPRLQFIQLSRRDKLRQAISHARALQTGVWKIANGKSPSAEARFNPRQIAHCLESARIEEKIWSEFFAGNNIEPLRLTYEELCADYEGTVESVLESLRIRLPRQKAVGNPVTVRQTDALNAEWEERYRALTGQLAVS